MQPLYLIRTSLNLLTACWLFLSVAWFANAEVEQYLFIGHPRDDGPGEIVQRDVERIDYSSFDLLLLGGDYTWRGTGSRDTVDYLNAVFDLSAQTTLAALGNHDTSNKDYFTDITGRPRFYAFATNDVTFVVLDTTDDGRDIQGDELQMLADTVDSIPENTHLVIVHHHLIWLADYAPLAHLQGSPKIGASSANLSDLNFYEDVYPLLQQARAKGVQVICLAGDRTGTETEEFFIDHTTVDGIRFIAAGLKEELTPSLRTVVVLEHDTEGQTLTCQFKHLTDLPRIPDHPIVINELHYDPSQSQGDDWAFVEIFNRGDVAHDISGAMFATGITFTFPDDTEISPSEHVLVAANSSHYTGLASQVFEFGGHLEPNAGEPIWLRDSHSLEIDYVDHETTAPWPAQLGNQGPSLMLIAPQLDNSLGMNWAASDQLGGTPGEKNIPAPIGRLSAIQQNSTTVAWDGVAPNAWYRLDFTASLDPANWQPIGNSVQAISTTLQFVDPTPTTIDHRFFRLTRLFP